MKKLPDLNIPLTVKALTLFINRETEQSGFSDVVLGLSGGLDSAVVACLAAEALGPEHVTALMLPYRKSSKNSLKDAEKLVEQTGIKHRLLDISTAVDAFSGESMIEAEKSQKLRLGNVMARLRMTAVFDYSTLTRSIVLGTSNKSEIALGYATLFGDIASAFNPVGDLYKTELFSIAGYMGVPESIIEKPPSADLYEGQTDEGEIGYSYEMIDPLLYEMIENRKDKKQCLEMGFDEKLVEFVTAKLYGTHFKRKIPLIAKLSPRTFGVDFHYAKDITI
ncbi:MAG: NAD+ synthase [bacterium]